MVYHPPSYHQPGMAIVPANEARKQERVVACSGSINARDQKEEQRENSQWQVSYDHRPDFHVTTKETAKPLPPVAKDRQDRNGC